MLTTAVRPRGALLFGEWRKSTRTSADTDAQYSVAAVARARLRTVAHLHGVSDFSGRTARGDGRRDMGVAYRGDGSHSGVRVA